MSSANIVEQTDLAKTLIDNIYYPGAFEQMQEDDPERLASELKVLLADVTPNTGHRISDTTEEPQAPELSPIQQKRKLLKAMSAQVAPLVKAGDYPNINTAIIAQIYTPQGHTELHTYNDWLGLGYTVRKGEKALIIWGKPISKQKEAKGEATTTEDLENDFFPVCHLFSNKQVAPIKTKTDEPATI